MKKLSLCRIATILLGLLAITIHARPEMTIGHLLNTKLLGAALGLLSAIFGTQWIEYQKREDKTLAKPGWPTWVRRLLFSSLLCLTELTASARTTWTVRPCSPYALVDVTDGAGRYVTVGDYDLINEQARQTVRSFLQWYKTHLQAINRFPLVNQQAGKPYSVNLNNGERYLTYLKSSHLLTDAYLNQWRTYFKERNASFRLSPQDEGPPDGFEYDLVMLTQDVDKQLASLKSMKINHVVIVKNRATVTLTLLGAYEFRLLRQNNRWMINEILNTGEE